MLSSFMIACGDIEFYARELCRRVLRPRVIILSFISASYGVEFYDCVPGCRVSWPHAKNDESSGHVLNVECVGRVMTQFVNVYKAHHFRQTTYFK